MYRVPEWGGEEIKSQIVNATASWELGLRCPSLSWRDQNKVNRFLLVSFKTNGSLLHIFSPFYPYILHLFLKCALPWHVFYNNLC